MTRSRFSRYAWGVLAYNLIVILWGAYVRASVSGDGCGQHWPMCGGQLIPQATHAKTWIEFAHRVSSFFVIVLVSLLAVWAWRAFPRRHPARLGAALCLTFTFSEALLGAGLVLFKLVAHNASIYRAVAMSAHLVNTLILIGCITLTAWWGMEKPPITARGQGAIGYGVLFAILGTVLLAISGAVTALGDTLFPATSLHAALATDLSPTANILIRLRLLHPLIALSVCLYVVLIAGLTAHLRPSDETKLFARWVAGFFLAEIAIGVVNVTLLAPIPLQIVHLFVADLTWVSLVLLTAAALSVGVTQVELELVFRHPEAPELVVAAATWKDYLVLTKPRVISLLLFTTLAAMFIAKPGWPGLGLFVAVAIGGYMAAGAANTINMVIDRDIDGRMKRTTSRPTVTQRISSTNALRFAFALASGSFMILWAAANLLTAVLAFAGLVFYVIVYTLVLKRRTWHNIVIGGAAGAFPPLVGWAAVDGKLTALAWVLFAIIFVWTPVHFWALALLIKEDYAKAGIPMLPVVRGERATVLQIGMYAILTAVISALPLFQHEARGVYLAAIVLLNAILLLRSLQLYRQPDRPHAVTLYKYSMLYLALLFLMMAVDRAMPVAPVRHAPGPTIQVSRLLVRP